jgi:hypothetical protein
MSNCSPRLGKLEVVPSLKPRDSHSLSKVHLQSHCDASDKTLRCSSVCRTEMCWAAVAPVLVNLCNCSPRLGKLEVVPSLKPRESHSLSKVLSQNHCHASDKTIRRSSVCRTETCWAAEAPVLDNMCNFSPRLGKLEVVPSLKPRESHSLSKVLLQNHCHTSDKTLRHSSVCRTEMCSAAAAPVLDNMCNCTSMGQDMIV